MTSGFPQSRPRFDARVFVILVCLFCCLFDCAGQVVCLFACLIVLLGNLRPYFRLLAERLSECQSGFVCLFVCLFALFRLESFSMQSLQQKQSRKQTNNNQNKQTNTNKTNGTHKQTQTNKQTNEHKQTNKQTNNEALLCALVRIAAVNQRSKRRSSCQSCLIVLLFV